MTSPARITLAAASLGLLAGCATFTDDEIAVRVDDVEMSVDELNTIVDDAAVARAAADNELVRAQIVSEVLNNFVLDQVLRADLESLGATVPELNAELSAVTLQESVGLSFDAWQTIPPEPFDDAEVQARYELGPAESNITCTAHILVETESTANEMLDRLDDGDDFGELAGEFSTDPGSGAQGGTLPCDTTSGFSGTYIPEYVQAALEAEIGEPVGPVESQFGFHVILLRPFDELAAGELEPVLAQPPIRFGFVADDVDVYVNPRFGSFDGARGVVPLG